MMSDTAPTPDQPTQAVVPEEGPGDVPHLTLTDGFRFGCGFILAGVAAAFILVILAVTVALVAMLLNVPLPVGFP